MRDLPRLYLHMVGVRLKERIQYRVSFWLDLLTQILAASLGFAALALLFARFPSLRGWSLWEIGLLYAMLDIAFSFAETFGRGFDGFYRQIRQGTFDNMLIRPHSAFFMTLGSEFEIRPIGRLVQGMAVLLYAVPHLGIAWNPGKLLLLLGAIAGGTCFFLGLLIIGATLCFWTVESIEVINIFTYGGMETAQAPICIYREWFRNLFIFVVPLAFANYFPALRLLGRADPLGFPPVLQILAPLTGVAFLLVALGIWEFGVRHYQSTGH